MSTENDNEEHNMGYRTYFSGYISIPNASQARENTIRKRLEKIDKALLESGEFIIARYDNELEIKINTEWKDMWADWKIKASFTGFEPPGKYDSTMHNILLRLSPCFTDDTTGKIEAAGDERDDAWRLEIRGKNVELHRARLEFDKEETHVPTKDQLSAQDIVIMRFMELRELKERVRKEKEKTNENDENDSDNTATTTTANTTRAKATSTSAIKSNTHTSTHTTNKNKSNEETR